MQPETKPVGTSEFPSVSMKASGQWAVICRCQFLQCEPDYVTLCLTPCGLLDNEAKIASFQARAAAGPGRRQALLPPVHCLSSWASCSPRCVPPLGPGCTTPGSPQLKRAPFAGAAPPVASLHPGPWSIYRLEGQHPGAHLRTALIATPAAHPCGDPPGLPLCCGDVDPRSIP